MRWIGLSSLVILFAGSAEAQICTGNAVAYHTRARLGATEVANPVGVSSPYSVGSRRVGVEAGVSGVQRFVSLALSRRSFDSVPYPPNDTPPYGSWQPPAATSFNVAAGVVLPGMPIDVGICPLASLMQEWGPSASVYGDGRMRETHAAAIGVSTGVFVEMNQALSLVPFITSRYLLQQAVTRVDWIGGSDHRTTSTMIGEAGLSFVIANAVTIRPSVEREFRLGPGTRPRNAGAIRLSYDFGSRLPPWRENQ